MREQKESKHRFKTRQLPVQSDHDNRPDDFDSRLDKLGAKLDEQKAARDAEQNDKGLKDRAGMAYGLKIASEFVSAILVGTAIGWVLDKWLGTTPFGLIVFLILGFAAGVLNVMRAAGRISQPEANNRDG